MSEHRRDVVPWITSIGTPLWSEGLVPDIELILTPDNQALSAR